jgi:hypothetical protein
VDPDPPIACTLDGNEVPDRLGEWQAALAPVVSRELIAGGVRLLLPQDTSVAALAELARAEQACCTFFSFVITIDTRGVGLEVTGPLDAVDIVYSLFGTPA